MNRTWLSLIALTAFACGGDTTTDKPVTGDTADTDTTPVQGHRVLGEGDALPAAALLSIWGSSADDVWTVGADDGTGPLLLHYDGTAWSRVDTGSTGDLWWVWGDGQGTLFLSGAGGRVVEHDIGAGTFTEHAAADSSLILFGLWGTSATDVWTVGGNISGARDGGMIHYDGTTWTERGTTPPTDGGTTRSAFKVWGRATDDVWFVGTNAWISHWNGTDFVDVDPVPLFESTPLTTVSGDADSVVAVGGFGNASVARFDGSTWVDDSPPPADIAPGFNGVHAEGDHVVACGVRGAIWRRAADGTWAPTNPATDFDLHGCWVDPDGYEWAVGGDLITLTAGAVVTDHPDVPDISL